MTNTTTNATDTEKQVLSDNINDPLEHSTDAEQKLFTKQQVEALITDRIKRERKINESLLPVKQLVKTLSAKEQFKGKSYSEIAQKLVNVLSDFNANDGVCERCDSGTEDKKTEASEKNPLVKESCIDDTGCVAAQSVGNDENLREVNHGQQNEEKEEKGVQAYEQVSQGGNDIVKEKENDSLSEDGFVEISGLCEFKKKYPAADMNKLFDSDMFQSFAKGKKQSLMDICEDYCRFLSAFDRKNPDFEQQPHEDNFSYEQRRSSPMSSTAFSSHSGTSPVSDGLTKQQMEIAKSAGLSYREYAELLSSIPKSPTRTVN
ncbi:MAG: hypothetical protein J6K12_06145 [Clostridia bacterium]|nr:hypothetical protein [Clostridia bacterium]